MKRLYFAFLVIFCLLFSSACASGRGDGFYDKIIEDFGVKKDAVSFDVNDTASCFDGRFVHYHGRYFEDKDIGAVWISYTNAGFELTFSGTAISADFLATRADDVKSKPYIAVAVDNDYDPDHAEPIALTVGGKYSNGEHIGGGVSEHKRITLACGLEDGVHTVRVYKRSECQNSRLAVRSFSTDGAILPVQEKPLGLKMEFFGDSVTCGYAVESDDFYENFTTRTENGMKTYANYAANLLNADISTVAAGGYPLYRSIYSEYNHPSDIPSMLKMAEFEYQTSFDHPWDNSKYIPDVVVIALGANDGSVLGNLSPSSPEYNEFLENFERAYHSFIEEIYKVYPSTLIVISDEILSIGDVFGMIADRVVAEEAAKGNNVMRVRFTAESVAKDRTLPGAGHPNAEMQRIAGHELARALAERLGVRIDEGDFWTAYN